MGISRNRFCLPPFGQPSKASTNDPAQVLSIMKSTNFCEILSLLYGILIHETDSNQTILDNNSTVPLHEKTLAIVINSMIILNTLAILDLDSFQVRIQCPNFFLWGDFSFQTTLGEETISLQLRHVANLILAYCNQQQTTVNDSLFRQIILLIGYYCVLNQDNQVRCSSPPSLIDLNFSCSVVWLNRQSTHCSPTIIMFTIPLFYRIEIHGYTFSHINCVSI